MRKKSKYFLGILMLFIIVGGLVGWIVSSIFTNNQNKNLSQGGFVSGVGGGPGGISTPAKVTKFSDNLQNLFHEHGVLTGKYLKDYIDGKDTMDDKASLDKNSASIAALIGGIYGSDVTSQFISMWDYHIKEYVSYAAAAKKDDKDAKKVAEANLNSMADSMQNMINALNTDTSANKIGDYMKEHIAGTLLLIDAYVAKNQPQVAEIESANYDQAGRFSDYLSQNITTEKPDMFR